MEYKILYNVDKLQEGFKTCLGSFFRNYDKKYGIEEYISGLHCR